MDQNKNALEWLAQNEQAGALLRSLSDGKLDCLANRVAALKTPHTAEPPPASPPATPQSAPQHE